MMKFRYLLVACSVVSMAQAQTIKRDIPYIESADNLQKLDVYAPENAKSLPVLFWIHGGGWQTGDKADVKVKPSAFMDRGYVFVSTNYRLLPKVDMEAIVLDVSKSLSWVHDHIAEFGGDPNRIVVMGHSAGAQLAALICTDDRYLKADGMSLTSIKGCIPVDGDTYDIPLMIETSAARRKALGQPDPKFGHYQKFGSDPVKHRNFSAVNHIDPDRNIPPFLLLYVDDHPDTSAQARRLASELTRDGIPAKLFGASDTEHSKLNDDLGLPNDPSTKVMFDFVDAVVKP